MTLPLRTSKSKTKPLSGLVYPHELIIDQASEPGGLPSLRGNLETATAQRLTLVLRIHTQAGIPILEAHSQLEAEQQEFTFSDLRPLGIEAYAHKSATEQKAVAQRIWSRRAYGTLTTVDIP